MSCLTCALRQSPQPASTIGAVVKSSADPEILGLGIGAGINQKNTELKAKVDKALCELIADGTIKASSTKWFGVDLSNYAACKK